MVVRSPMQKRGQRGDSRTITAGDAVWCFTLEKWRDEFFVVQ